MSGCKELKIYRVPIFEPVSKDYYVEIEGQAADVFPVTVSSSATNELWRGTQRTEEEIEQASFINFNFSGTVRLRIVCAWEIFCARVLPLSKGIVPVRGEKNKGDEVSFEISEPGQYILEINGYHKPLHIFANPMETEKPNPADPNVDYRYVDEKQNFPGNFYGQKTEIAEGKDTLYFGPGVHHADKIWLKSGQKLYIDGNAVVYGTVTVEKGEDVKIFGRGILKGSRFSRDYTRSGLMQSIILVDCHNVRVEGIILQDAPTYHLSVVAGDNISIENIKIFSWRRNADGIDIHNASYLDIRNCFIRTFDDGVVIKGQYVYGGYETGHRPTAHILVEGCTLWTDWGRPLEFGAETSAVEMKDIVLRDCDVVHYVFAALDIQACGDAPISDVLFENIRVCDPIDPLVGPRLIDIFIRNMLWMAGEELGNVRNITFRDIAYTGLVISPIRFVGQSAEHDIRDIYLENITLNGRVLESEQDILAPIILNEFADGIYLDGRPVDRNKCHIATEEEICNTYLVGNGAFIVI